MNVLACVLGSLSIVLGASAAYTQTTAIDGGSPNHLDLTADVTASVAARCGFSAAPNGVFQAGDLHQGFSHDFSFTLDCSGPLRVAVASANGGLRSPSAAPASGYVALAPYGVTLSLVGDSGVTTVNASCAAAELLNGGGCLFRGPASSGQGLRLAGPSNKASGSYLRVSAPAYANPPLLIAANDYGDTLTVTMSAAP